MITRWTFLISILLLISGVIPAAAFGQEHRRNQSGWPATVECDSLVVYSQMSTQSRVVGHLNKGDIVTINLEFIGAGGAWCSVAEPGKRVRLGYVQSECLEREQTESVTVWQAQSPPAQTMPETEPVQRTDTPSQKRPTREEIEQEVDRVLASRLNEHLSFSYLGSAGLSTFHSATLHRASLPPCKCDRAIFSGEGEQGGRSRVCAGLQLRSESQEKRRLDRGLIAGRVGPR